MELQKLRKSASLIVHREKGQTLEYIMLTRKSNMSFASSCVFPGGVCQLTDKHHNKEEFIEYGKVTAIRETFEETGLLVLPQEYPVEKLSYKVGDSMHDLVNSCWDSNSLKRILPVIRLMTIQMKGKRYDTWFYVAGPKTKMINLGLFARQPKDHSTLSNLDRLITDDESHSYRWETCLFLLDAAAKQEILLFPPQIILLGCLQNYHTRKDLIDGISKIDDFSPTLMSLNLKAAQAYFPCDYRYDHQKILKNQPESESKQELAESISKIKGTKQSMAFYLDFTGPHNVECTTGKTNLISLFANSPKAKL